MQVLAYTLTVYKSYNIIVVGLCKLTVTAKKRYTFNVYFQILTHLEKRDIVIADEFST